MPNYGLLMCPAYSSKVNVGDGPVTGVSVTTTGDNFMHASGKLNVEAKGGDIWIQGGAGVGVVAAAGVTLGTDAGIFQSAGGDVIVFAGAAMSPSIGSPDGPGGPPTAPKVPCADTEKNVTRLNSLNAGVKAVSDVRDAYKALAAADPATLAQAGAKVYDGAKATWDLTKAGVDLGTGGEMSDSSKKVMGGIDNVFKMADVVRGSGNLKDLSSVPNPFGAYAGGKGLVDAASGKKADAGKGGAPGAPSGTVGGGGKIEMRAPTGIKMLTDANIEGIASGKVEYKAGTNIVLNAFSKVETCSLVFEAYANISATMKGLARAKVESAGLVGITAGAKFEMAAGGPASLKTGATLTVDSAGTTKFKAGAKFIAIAGSMATVSAGSKLTLHGKGSTEILGASLTVKSADSTFNKAVTCKDTVEIIGNLTAKAKGTFTGKVTGKGGGKISGTVQLG